ncbi:MAG: hypothetical protein DRG59_06245 [Deltaproteobacteria bacterium]|nr:MAG: hypothetical protein DRG59_06245 [Deltaproteobacteria bacterium]
MIMDVVIVGGGFAGAFLARYLGQKNTSSSEHLRVILLSKTNYLLFQPFMIEGIIGDIEIRHLVTPLRTMLDFPNVEIRRTEVQSIDLQKRELTTTHGTVRYDKLVLAPGSVTNFFGVPGARESCRQLKNLRDVLDLRAEILERFELANLETDDKRQKDLLTLAIIGAGPTGVELATGLHDYAFKTLVKYYKNVHPENIKIILIEATSSILAGFDTGLVNWAEKKITSMKIDLRLNSAVEKIEGNTICFTNGKTVQSDIIVWTAGIQANKLVKMLGKPLDCMGRVEVDPHLRLPGHPEVFVLGDAARVPDIKTGDPLPPEAQVALQQAKYVARHLKKGKGQKPRKPFKFIRLGRLASLGSKNAVTQILFLRFTGCVAWFIWRTVYLFRFKGIRNKVRLMFDWTFALFFDRDITLMK